jgi:predicted DNA-binding ribbon-helix-helix protein
METAIMELNASRKRSVIVRKRRTSISLEDSFWNSLHAIVRMENTTIGDFIDRISRQRATPNLSSSLRVAVLEYYKHMAMSNIVIGTDTARPADQVRPLAPVVSFWNGLERRHNPFGTGEATPGATGQETNR